MLPEMVLILLFFILLLRATGTYQGLLGVALTNPTDDPCCLPSTHHTGPLCYVLRLSLPVNGNVRAKSQSQSHSMLRVQIHHRVEHRVLWLTARYIDVSAAHPTESGSYVSRTWSCLTGRRQWAATLAAVFGGPARDTDA